MDKHQAVSSGPTPSGPPPIHSEATPSVAIGDISPSRGEKSGADTALSAPEGVAAAVAEGDEKPTVWLFELQGAGRPEGVASGSGAKSAALRDTVAHARKFLAAAGIPDPSLETRLLLENFASVSPTESIANPAKQVHPEAIASINAALLRRAQGEPLHRILGWREFYGLRLSLSPETLEPRPDTETLVDAVLPFVQRAAERKGSCRILDLGTGTGAVALALLSQVRQAQAVGADISADALETAFGNARRLGLADRFTPVRSDWFERISGRFDGIVSNPPYISADEFASLDPAITQYDPPAALDGGKDGLDAYRKIAAGAMRHLEPQGMIAVEMGFRQRDVVSAIFAEHGFVLHRSHTDLGGNDRVLVLGLGEKVNGAQESGAQPLGNSGE